MEAAVIIPARLARKGAAAGMNLLDREASSLELPRAEEGSHSSRVTRQNFFFSFQKHSKMFVPGLKWLAVILCLNVRKVVSSQQCKEFERPSEGNRHVLQVAGDAFLIFIPKNLNFFLLCYLSIS